MISASAMRAASACLAIFLAAMPGLRAFCDVACVPPPVTTSPPESHCASRNTTSSPASPVKGDECGHPHDADRVVVNRALPTGAGIAASPAEEPALGTIAPESLVRAQLSAACSRGRPDSPSVPRPLRI